MEAVALFFAWNFKILRDGILPSHGFYQEPWACQYRRKLAEDRTPLFGPYRACFGGWKGDLKARKECHFCKAGYQSKNVCDSCAARRPFLYTNLRPDAPWRASPGENMRNSPWHCVPGFDELLVHYDIMHVGPLGIWRNLCAAVVLDMLRRGQLRYLTATRALADLRLEFHKWCTASHAKCQAKALTLKILGIDV